jgi:hypothetical protein
MISADTVIKAIEELGLHHSISEDRQSFMLSMPNGDRLFRIHVEIEDGGCFLHMYTAGLPCVDLRAPAGRRTLDGLNELNNRIRVFKFAIRPGTGEIEVSFEAWFRESTPTELEIGSHILQFRRAIREALAWHRAAGTVLDPRYYEC